MIAGELDRAGCRALRALPHRRASDAFLVSGSRVAEHGAILLGVAATGVVLDPARRSAWAGALAAVAATEMISQRIKRPTRRPRPDLPGLPPLAATPARYSFPSAHTATACAAAVSFARARRLAATAAVATGLSRPYLGVHYPSDVVARAALGMLIAATLTRACRG